MADIYTQTAVKQVEKPFTLIPVGLREASYDSPTFRATTIHFADQVEIIEKWLEAYIKPISKMINEVSSIEDTYNSFIFRSIPPANISEAVIDHDYTLLAMKRYGESSREWWSQMITCVKKIDSNIADPIRTFMAVELRNFKEAKKQLELTQKTFDNTLSRYVGQSKTKEPSSLREDAFQVHETRKAYLKASLDFCILAPQLRFAIDKLLVRISFDQWREMKRSSEHSTASFAKFSNEMDRVRGWSKEIESGETVFRRELQFSRREIAELASESSIPSREIEDYNVSTVAFLGSRGASSLTMQVSQEDDETSDKHGWLFLKVTSGKPARTSWVRYWFYVRNGIFGWLIQGSQSGAVEESERIGVLLCSVKPAVQEDRRFCFEVKTNNQAILVQAETQNQLMEWLKAFECAKNKILEVNAKSFRSPGSLDPAFNISGPLTPEFAMKSIDQVGDEQIGNILDRSSTLQFSESANVSRKTSMDFASRWSTTPRDDNDTGKDHLARKIQRLDLTRKPLYPLEPPATPASTTAGGIASLISASHNIFPVSLNLTGMNTVPKTTLPSKNYTETRTSSLAPATLAISPAPTNLSKAAILMSSEREIAVGRNSVGGIPSVIIANVWGSSVWEYINRLEKGETRSTISLNKAPYSSMKPPKSSNFSSTKSSRAESRLSENSRQSVNPSIRHTKSPNSYLESKVSQKNNPIAERFPQNYPAELRTQEAQFRILFPGAPQEHKVLLVFRATWNPNEQQEFPGRVYVTQRDMFFYSHHLGLVLTTGIKMNFITEVTAAPGKDCDFLFLHIRDDSSAKLSRITIKTFLEPLRLLELRLNYLVGISQVNEKIDIENIIDALISLEDKDDLGASLSWDSGEDDEIIIGRDHKYRDLANSSQTERGSYFGKKTKDIPRFHLPSQPFLYEPPGVQRKFIEREFNVTPKALFHVIFGDKSAVFQLHYQKTKAKLNSNGPWLSIAQDPTRRDQMRREFELQIDSSQLLIRTQKATIVDYQVIDVINDNICYVVTTYKTLWQLPYNKNFKLVFKMVITHMSKSKCKLAIYARIDWSKPPIFFRGLVERQAFDDSALDAEDLVNLISEQIPKLGPDNTTKRSIILFGRIGRKKSVPLVPKIGITQEHLESQRRTLTSILLKNLISFTLTAIIKAISWFLTAFKLIWGVFSVNWIILMLLLASVLTNGLFTSRGALDWWSERKAANFMARLGVGPNRIVSKSIYLKDLDEALKPLYPKISGNVDSSCYNQFKWIMNVTEMNSHHDIAGTLFSDISTKSTAQKLRRTRQRLGTYRHDLLIAVRIVNQVERTLLEGEWENWLLNENMKCKQVSLMLQNVLSRAKDSPKNLADGEDEASSQLREVRKWQEKYCDSCALDQDLLSQRDHLAFD
ncbi:hypothetical protein K3495_g3001 [Podosphaera aphanis]|nr:hypothetical protein K3495_g3001 [Podosphaera aphanis]